jgi:hypothetical protein
MSHATQPGQSEYPIVIGSPDDEVDESVLVTAAWVVPPEPPDEGDGVVVDALLPQPAMVAKAAQSVAPSARKRERSNRDAGIVRELDVRSEEMGRKVEIIGMAPVRVWPMARGSRKQEIAETKEPIEEIRLH